VDLKGHGRGRALGQRRPRQPRFGLRDLVREREPRRQPHVGAVDDVDERVEGDQRGVGGQVEVGNAERDQDELVRQPRHEEQPHHRRQPVAERRGRRRERLAGRRRLLVVVADEVGAPDDAGGRRARPAGAAAVAPQDPVRPPRVLRRPKRGGPAAAEPLHCRLGVTTAPPTQKKGDPKRACKVLLISRVVANQIRLLIRRIQSRTDISRQVLLRE
jgi:hypothetical protein